MPPELIIFDCDGVLIDSEGVASMVIARELTGMGWPMDADEAMRTFIGMSIADMVPMIEERLSRRLHATWRPELAEKLVVALGEEVELIPGADTMLERVNAFGIEWRVASNSSDEEMAVKFSRTGHRASYRRPDPFRRQRDRAWRPGQTRAGCVPRRRVLRQGRSGALHRAGG